MVVEVGCIAHESLFISLSGGEHSLRKFEPAGQRRASECSESS